MPPNLVLWVHRWLTLTKSEHKRRVEESNSPRTPSWGSWWWVPPEVNYVDNDDDEFSRAIVNENNNCQSTPWIEDPRGLEISFAQGGPPIRNGCSVSPRDLQQYADNYAAENGVKPEIHGKETGHSYYTENTGLYSRDQESIEYTPDEGPLGIPAQKRTGIVTTNTLPQP